MAEVKIIYKKCSLLEKSYYHSVRTLPNLSIGLERCTFTQMSLCFHRILFKYQCGFRKGYGAKQFF